MEIHRTSSFGTFETHLRLASTLRDTTEVEFLFRLPALDGVQATVSLPGMRWLRGRMRWECSFAVLPCPRKSPLIVLRAGFFDRDVGDVPVTWSNR